MTYLGYCRYIHRSFGRSSGFTNLLQSNVLSLFPEKNYSTLTVRIYWNIDVKAYSLVTHFGYQMQTRWIWGLELTLNLLLSRSGSRPVRGGGRYEIWTAFIRHFYSPSPPDSPLIFALTHRGKSGNDSGLLGEILAVTLDNRSLGWKLKTQEFRFYQRLHVVTFF